MKSIYLVRHAKSSWQYADMDDVDRPLKGRGVRDANMVSQWLKEECKYPEVLLSSPATRALHTAMIFARNLNYPLHSIQIEEGLYLSDIKTLRSIICNLDDRYDTAMIFGHNPTLTKFVNHTIDQRIDNVPTSGVACLTFPVDQWKDAADQADLIYFDCPKNRREE